MDKRKYKCGDLRQDPGNGKTVFLFYNDEYEYWGTPSQMVKYRKRGKNTQKKYRSIKENRQRTKEYQQRPENRLRKKELDLMRRYDLSLQDFYAMLDDQKNCCILCGEPFTDNNIPVVDHDHNTNAVRGLIHDRCNTTLGFIEKIGIGYASNTIQYVANNKFWKTE